MFGFFKGLKRKKKMTDEQLLPYWEELSAVPKFQWIKTERAGLVSYFQGVTHQNGMVLIEFADGSRVNYDMLGDAVMKIYDDTMLLDLGDEAVVQQPRPQHRTQVGPVSIGQPAQKENPIHQLLNKQKENPVGISIEIQLNLPPAQLYAVLSSSFENAEDEIVDYVVQGIDVPAIKDAVRRAILNHYNG